MTSARRCSGCGEVWPRRARWCGSCGRPLRDAPPVPPAVPTSSRAWRVPGALLIVGALALASLVLVVADVLPTGRASGPQPETGGTVTVPPGDDVPARPPTMETIADGPRCRDGGDVIPCVVWNVAEPASARLATRLVDGLVVTVARDGTVRTRSAVDGAIRWTAELPFPVDGEDRDEVEILPSVGATIPIRAGDRLAFLTLAEGRLQWAGEPAVRPEQAVAVGAWVVVGDGRRWANLSTVGTSTWQRELTDDEQLHATGQGLYLVRGRGTVERLSADGGGVVWTRELDAPVRPLPVRVLGDTTLFAVDGADPFLVGFDRGDGETALLLPLAGPVVDVVASGPQLVVLAEGSRGIVAHLAEVTGEGITAQGRAVIGTSPIGFRTPRLQGGQLAVAGSNPTPIVDVYAPDGRRTARYEPGVAPYDVLFDGPDRILIATVDGVTARPTTGDGDGPGWRVQLRSATFLAERPGDPPVVQHRRGLTRLTGDG